MNFTREPIIETVITPKEGCKLLVRSSKGVGPEEYFVDAVEVVSFGNSIFYRSLERPKSFLVPVSDYEIVELKETRMVLKSITADKTIKIAGGREPSRQPKEEQVPEEHKKRDKKRLRRKRSTDKEETSDKEEAPEKGEMPEKEEGSFLEVKQTEELHKGGGKDDEAQVSSSTVKRLFPPPNTLIKESLSRYKTDEISEELILPKELEEKKEEFREPFSPEEQVHVEEDKNIDAEEGFED